LDRGGTTKAELDELEREERTLSDRRRRLQERIDFVRGGGAEATELSLQRLLAEERELSTRRRELHKRIDELRVELGLPPGPPAKTKRLGG
jgi:hypothetical protein